MNNDIMSTQKSTRSILMKKDEIVLDPTDINAVRTAYNNIMRALMEKLSAKVKATRGVK